MRCLVVVADGVRALELGCILDAIEALNRIIQPARWAVEVVSPEGGPRRAADGRVSIETCKASEAGPAGLALVLGGADARVGAPAHLALVQRLLRSGATVCLLSEAAAVLARQGVLAGRPVCLPWDHPLVLEGSATADPGHDGIYLRSGRVVTSAGTASTLDLVLTLVAEALGSRVAMRLADVLKAAPARPGSASQRCGLGEKYQTSNPVLLQVLALMEDHLETPLAIRDIAARAGRSTRQLERLFLTRYGLTPKRFYEGIRVRRAHWMVAHSEFPITEIALMCGFASYTSFSKAFSRQFGTNPSAVRSRARLPEVEAAE
jgi:AraC family carnitine catabolism transcriptional activator